MLVVESRSHLRYVDLAHAHEKKLMWWTLVVKIMTPLRLGHMTSFAVHRITNSVSSNKSHPTTWLLEWLQSSAVWGLWMWIWISIFASQHHPINHAPLKPITTGGVTCSYDRGQIQRRKSRRSRLSSLSLRYKNWSLLLLQKIEIWRIEYVIEWWELFVIFLI